MQIDNLFKFGDPVYLVTDTEQNPCLVTGIVIRPGGLMYELSYDGNRVSTHYAFEIALEKNIMLAINS